MRFVKRKAAGAMAERTGSRAREWLLRQALPQADGSYLVRPFKHLPPFVYQVDVATRDRLVALQVFYRRAMLPLIFIVALLFNEGLRSWTFWAAPLAILVAGYGGPFLVLRRATRVPRSRWQGPAAIAPEAYFSRRTYVTLFVISTAMVLLLGEAIRWTLNQPGAAFP